MEVRSNAPRIAQVLPIRGLGCATRMATIDSFDHILNWKLKAGSHPFPGKDGGTCINEAALVAAGAARGGEKPCGDA